MPRIDPLQLLNCLQVLLSPNGGILSKNEVHRLASLMTKFSKKLVSKCVYVLILKNTEITLLGLFMAAGGWTLIHLWLHDAIYTMNWALVKELLELLLLTPVDVERLKSNNIPKLVKSLSKREDLQGVHELSNQLVQQWLKIVKDETQYEINSQQRTIIQSVIVSEEVNQHAGIQQEHHQTEQMGEDDVVENDEYDSGINSQTFYKLTLKDGKHLISKVGATDTNFQVLENVEVVEMKDDEDVKDKEKRKSSHDKSKHKSSSSKSSGSGSSSSSRDKDRSSHKVKSKHSSSSKDRSRDKHKHDKSKDKDRHRSNGSVSKSSSKSSSGSSSSSSSKDKKDSKDKQAEKDKDTLSKIQPYTLQKLPKIPKKSSEEKDKTKDKKDDIKKGSISVEVRKTNEERPKTVKVYKSKMRSTGLEEEAKPAPPRPTKKPVTPPVTPAPPVPTLKRTSPIRDLTPAAPPEKKTKVEPPLERPGAIKLIPPKPKPAVLQESDMFMDALTASATTKKEPKKRKRRASVSKDSTGTSPPSSPSSKEAVPSLKNLSPPKFYQDTLETEEAKANSSENLKPTSDSEDNAKENNSISQVSDRIPTPTESMAEEEDLPRTKNSNGLKGVLVYVRRKGPKKSIKWKPDEELVDIQYFELDETERVNVTKTFGDLAKMDVRGEREALQMSRKLPNEDVMDVHTIWRIPFEIDIPEPLAEPGCKSLEKDIQFAREKSVLQAIYFNKKMLPETPVEPDPEMYQVKDSIVIPVDAADNPDHDFRDTPWPEPKGSPPPQNIPNNVSTVFPNVQGPYTNFPITGAPNFQNIQNMPNVQQQFQGPPFMQQNVMGGGGGEWNNVNMPNMHNQMMPRNMPPPEMMNQGLMNPNMFIPPQENFNPIMNENNHRFPPPFNNQGPGMFPNNFNRGGMGGFRRGGGGGGGGGNGPWLRMNVPSPGNWNVRNGGPPHRGGGRICHHFRNKGFCKNGDNCLFFHPNN